MFQLELLFCDEWHRVVALPRNKFVTGATLLQLVRAQLWKLQKGCTRLTATSDKVYQLLAHGRWCTPASSTTKTGRHNITESCVKHQNSNSLKFAQPSGFVTLNLKICFRLCVPIGLFFNSQPLTWFKTFLRLSGFVSLRYYVY